MKKYNHKTIEQKWQKIWEETDAFKAEESSQKPKFYGLIEFPYPSGQGLHVGHIRSNTAMDIIVRKRRREGYSVLYPIGWDAFGLPTENYALKTGASPQEVTKKNTDTFRRQLKALGFSFDWSREINTTDPSYYKWTQWIFLKLFEKGLAYKKKMPINWCIDCKTGLANEEVLDEVCERCGGDIEIREKEQWLLKITAYADRLLDDLDSVDYLEKIKVGQRNWIGRSEGAEIKFKITGLGESKVKHINVFTTRPDTLFGATYVVLAPEHPLVRELKDTIENYPEVQKYTKEAQAKKDFERTSEDREKTGIKLKGVIAINPANNEEIPIFIADYVLVHYGTSAIMAVPAHDERDYEFAQKFNLPIRQVIAPRLVQTTEPGAFREKEPVVFSDGIIVLVKHWEENKYIALKWKEVEWGTLLTGGIERDETPEQTVLREIREETGFLHAQIMRDMGVVDGMFYHVPKKENRVVHGHMFYVELQNNEQEQISEEEAARHDIEWLTLDELINFLTAPTHRYAIEEFKKGKGQYIGDGTMINSGAFNNLESEKAKKKITEFVKGSPKTTYKLRDWIFSRQRYWGEPIPIIHCDTCGMIPVPESDLPVELPHVENYEPTDSGESPLAQVTEWVNVSCPKCGGEGKRETDTMPNWAGSSWYYLRYTDPHNDTFLAGKEALEYWSPVDWYNGGMEHTTLHLLYSRFWHKVLYDYGIVPTNEPYQKRTSHGMILAQGGQKMSKSKGNVVNPDDIVNQFGADTLRIYEMFMGPFSESINWNDDNIIGSRRFLEKVWKLYKKVDDTAINSLELESSMHKTIKKVSEDIEKMHFNTAVSTLMIFVNELEKEKNISTTIYKSLLGLLAPFAPHITEELWFLLGEKSSIHKEPWHVYDEEKTKETMMTIVVQINGKVRGDFEVSTDTSEEVIKETALSLDSVKKWCGEKVPKKIIYVDGRLVSVVFGSK